VPQKLIYRPDDEPLSDLEIEGVQYAVRYEIATRALDLRLPARGVLQVMLVRDQAHTISGLARTLYLSRNTIRETVERLQRQGLIYKDGRAYRITDIGAALMARLHRETGEICLGRRRGFTKATITYFKAQSATNPRPEASRISFSELKILNSMF